MRPDFSCKFIFMALLLAPMPSMACAVSEQAAFRIIPLYNDTLVSWLENKNRLSEICPGMAGECVVAALDDKLDIVPLYDQPDGTEIANLTVNYSPGRGISARVEQPGISTPYQPTVYDADWGYGPWFHATVLDVRAGWQKIALPGLGSAWIKSNAEMRDPQADDVYRMGERHVVVVERGVDHLKLRDEQPADMWCAPGDPPTLKPFKTETRNIADLYNDRCELVIVPAYLRGC